jgi:ferric-dicitrate binding protein FerR (iron transport regulator)
MTEERDQERVEAFEARLRAWAARPPTIPPRAAAEAVVARLARRPRRVSTWRLAAAVAATVLAVTGVLVGRRGARGPEPAVGAVASIQPLPDNVMQFWLDAETPVYFVTGPERPVQGGL